MKKWLAEKEINSNIFKYYTYLVMYGLMVPGIVFTVFMLDRGLNYSQIGFLESIFGVAMLFEIFTGAFADLIGRRVAVFFGTIFVGIACIGYVFSTAFWHFAVVYILWGIGIAVYSGSDTALIYDSLKAVGRKKDFIKIYGKGRMFFLVSGMVGAPMGAYLYSVKETLPFIVGSVFFFIGALIFLFTKEVRVHRQKKYHITTHYSQIKLGFKYLFVHKNVRWMLFFGMLVTLYWAFFSIVQTPFLLKRGFQMSGAGWIFSFVAAVEAFFSFSAEKIHRHFSEKNCFLLILLSQIVSSIGLAYAFNLPVIALFALQKFGFGFGRTFSEHYFQKHSDSRIRATLMTIEGFMLDFIIIIFVPLLGMLTDVSSLKITLLTISAVSIVFGAVLMKFFPVHNHKFVW